MKTTEEMKEFRGTKGEWVVSGGTSIVSMPSQCKITNSVSGWSYDEAKANAQLIAAAPELLGALQNMVKGYKHLVDGEFGNVDWSNEYEVIERGHDEIIDAEKAINKALGL